MVENNEIATSRPGGVTGKGFLPGKSGNPGGRAKTPEAFKELARSNSMEALEAAISIMKSKKEKSSDRLKAVEIVLDRSWGKPVQGFDIGVRNHTENPVIEIILNDPELSQFYQELYRKAIERGNKGYAIPREITVDPTE